VFATICAFAGLKINIDDYKIATAKCCRIGAAEHILYFLIVAGQGPAGLGSQGILPPGPRMGVGRNLPIRAREVHQSHKLPTWAREVH
jgi:hypothetical protein